MRVVVDASVVVKWYIPEKHHEEARKLRDDYFDGKHELVAPHLLGFEAVNVLKYSGHYEDERLVEAAQSLSEYGLELRPFGDSGRVAETADELDVSVYDASYVALASAVDSVVFTADEALVEDTAGTEYAENVEHIRDYTETLE
jgi:predicted nucleic acid-binding protein